MDDSIQRKIELQSPDDLRYLITNVRKAATDSINAAFPPVLDDEGNPIPKRKTNHHNPQTDHYEPFDPRKRDRIESLVSQEEDLLRSIAQLKRRVPAATASAYMTATNSQIATDEEMLSAVLQRAREEGLESGKKALEGMGELDRQEVVEGTYTKAVETLGRLKRDMPAVVAKMERARVAGGYVVGKQNK
ncbi:hypothetical protein QC764_509230 [Podospora pseudoanserina]|uniref:Kinetochore protein n=1 Tax=Podospora pseudoanserina TaxID=2609844 RepID=A0ABR0I899_9PEZI|nr:hypothetical protein QC764_509230 [Podospora pseudoanserina]